MIAPLSTYIKKPGLAGIYFSLPYVSIHIDSEWLTIFYLLIPIHFRIYIAFTLVWITILKLFNISKCLMLMFDIMTKYSHYQKKMRKLYMIISQPAQEVLFLGCTKFEFKVAGHFKSTAYDYCCFTPPFSIVMR